MTHMDPSEPPRGLRLPRIPPGLWVVLALLAGASPWVAATMLEFGP
jgi:hypothetical protein